MWKTIAFVGLIVVLFLLTMTLVNCKEGTSLPTGTTQLEPLVLGGQAPPAEAEESVSAEWETSNDGETWFVEMKNTSFDFRFNAACYVDGDAPVAQQRVVKPYTEVDVRRGKKATLTAALECGEVHQCDFFSGVGVPQENPDLGGRLLQAKRVVAAACEKKKGCVQPKAPECEHGPAVWFQDRCEWVCPPPQNNCPAKPDPECPEQTWLPFPQCIWVGECPCVPDEPPICDFGEPIYDKKTCTWSCPSCPSKGDPDCPTQTWDEKECKWVGECVCDPPGEPPDCCQLQVACPPAPECECISEWLPFPECKWDQECVCECIPPKDPPCKEFCEYDAATCEWTCDYPSCAPGFEFNKHKCECEATKICHVSNKGTDGDWNLQEQTVNASPGHLKHLNINKFCPPDYLGVCDGRSASWTPDMCPN